MQHYTNPLSKRQKENIAAVQSKTPTTWLLPADSAVPAWLRGAHKSIAVRITQHPISQALVEGTNGIVSSSANFSDYPTAINEQQLRDWFGPYLDYVIIGAPGTGAPSEIRDLLTGKTIR